jgi:hypothetical protein
MVMLSGQGCQNAVAGWEKRLFHFLTNVAIRPSISRIDLAHDDIDGAYLSVDWAYDQYALGGYTQKAGGRPPNIERIGNWTRPTGKGRTLTIGFRGRPVARVQPDHLRAGELLHVGLHGVPALHLQETHPRQAGLTHGRLRNHRQARKR